MVDLGEIYGNLHFTVHGVLTSERLQRSVSVASALVGFSLLENLELGPINYSELNVDVYSYYTPVKHRLREYLSAYTKF